MKTKHSTTGLHNRSPKRQKIVERDRFNTSLPTDYWNAIINRFCSDMPIPAFYFLVACQEVKSPKAFDLFMTILHNTKSKGLMI